ncbi:CusA/CzcA family heavy metal efflux RND transporter [Alteromonas sp. 14N.309.X.WAT.G.H12]|uniref:efflux RND transporter permease subunit n=1 Tax=Alteromonas sp. 14N.309.X.WAT.G.H12 TaxID=3120824 RepID=UPI002FD3034C
MINTIIRLSITRRYLMLSLIVVLVGVGLWSYKQLPIDAVPDITNIQVQINTKAPGYSPLETEQRVTFPIETALYGLPQLEYTRSISRYGLSQITVVFKEGTDIYFARNLIDERLGAIKSRLPAQIEPTMGPIASGLGEIFMYTIEAAPDAQKADGTAFDAIALREIQEWIIKPQLAQVSGIVEINTFGGYNKQFHVLPDPKLLLEHEISFSDLAHALRNNNNNRGAGFIEQNGQQLLVRLPGQLNTIADIEQVVVGKHHNAPVFVKDVAEVAIGKELRSGAATADGKETVIGIAMMLVGENAQQVAKEFADKLEAVKASLPDGVYLRTVYDRTELVNKTIHTVQTNLLEGALLVIVVLFVLLGNLRAALITAAVIPLSMLATLFGMVQTGVTANLMSLGALDFGLIVDCAVIIVENGMRRLANAQQKGLLPIKQRLDLVYGATVEVIRPALFGVVIITVVYIPIFTLTGVEGKMFYPMAATVVMALIAAMIFALTLVPAMVAVFMKGKMPKNDNMIVRYSKSLYRPVLKAVLRMRLLIVSSALLLVVASTWLMSTLGSEFIPQLDEGDITLHAMRIPGTSLSQSVAMQKTLEDVLLVVPEVKKVFSRIGTPDIATDPMPPNVTDTFVLLKPRSQWRNPDMAKEDLVALIEKKAKSVPGNNYEFTQPIQMRFNELISGVRSDLGIKIFGDDLSILKRTADNILAVVKNVEGAADARVEQVEGIPLLSIEPDRTELARYGLNVADLQFFLAAAIGGEGVGEIYQGDRRFTLAIRLPEGIRNDVHQFGALPVALPDGGYIPLSEIAHLSIKPAPAQVSRENGKRRVVVTTNVRERDLGSFVDDVKQQIQQHVEIPSGYWLDFGGTFEQLQSASARLSIVVPVTLAIILGLLVMAFGSLKDGLIIFSGVPLALTGGVFALWLRDMPLSISAGVGFIALSGVAVLNGLVMVTFIRDLWHKNGDLLNAIVDGAVIRLRPVLMTAFVASLGFVPMALNTGTGAEVQRPLATVVIGGVISSTVLTLIVLPALYSLVHRRKTPSPL